MRRAALLNWYTEGMRLSRLVLLGVLVVVILGTLFSRRCGEDGRRAVRVEEGRVIVTNLSDQAWSEIDVWLNRWYRAQAPALSPGQRLEIPLRVFVAGPGRNFDPAASAAVSIQVTAKSVDGSDVRLTWRERKGDDHGEAEVRD
jgi:hypothetical protein